MEKVISNGRTYIINKDMMALLQKHIDEEIYYTIRPQNVIVIMILTLNKLVELRLLNILGMKNYYILILKEQ